MASRGTRNGAQHRSPIRGSLIVSLAPFAMATLWTTGGVQIGLGYLMLGVQADKAAEVLFRDATLWSPASRRAHWGLGVSVHPGDPSMPMALATALHMNPKDRTLLAKHSLLYVSSRTASAIQKCQAVNPTRPRALQCLCSAYSKLGDRVGTIRWCGHLVESGVRAVTLSNYVSLGRALRASGRAPEAIEILETTPNRFFSRRHPQDYYLLLADLYQDVGQPERARELLRSVSPFGDALLFAQ